MNKYRFWKGSIIKEMSGNNIFVFGSNPEGRHGAGAAKAAMKFGAKYGIGRGHKGNTYALPTKNLKRGYFEVSTGIVYHTAGARSLTEKQISDNIQELYDYAVSNPELMFVISYQVNSRNLNGYSSLEMIKMFTINKVVPSNIVFHNSFRPMILEHNL